MSAPPPPMTAEQAAWIRKHAHRPQHGRRLMQPRRMGQAECLHLAPPECSECRAGCHQSCTGTSWPRLEETWILDSHGSSLYWEDLPHLVWTPPRPCACACRTAPAPAAPAPAPIPAAAPAPTVAMTDADAALVRELVWTQEMRTSHRETPRAASACACQHGLSLLCMQGAHDQCHRATALASPEDYIGSGDGGVAEFPRPYAHPTATATGRHLSTLAQVWLADRICRWVCPCTCHTPTDTRPAQAAAPGARPIQDALF